MRSNLALIYRCYYHGSRVLASNSVGIMSWGTAYNITPKPSQPSSSWKCLFSSNAARIVSFPLAQTGEGISECEMVRWSVQEGDTVEEFGQLCEVQSDKATIEITSRYTGRVVKLHHQQGDIVKVGAPLLDIELEAGTEEVHEQEMGTQAPEAADTTSAPPTTPLISQGPDSRDAPPHAIPQPLPAAATKAQAAPVVLASPAVRRVARECGVEIEAVVGSGPGGRVLEEDVLRAAGKATGIPSPSSPPKGEAEAFTHAASASAITQADAASATEEEPIRLPIRGYRRAMVKSMTEAATIPHFHFMDEVDVTHLTRIRSVLRSHPSTQGLKLTLLPFLIKALSVALHQHPTLNASLAPDGGSLLLHRQHNIGVAMATPGGLVVPNIKQVQHKSILDIARELDVLQASAQQGRLSTEQVTGGTITVSNIGTVGGTYATPLVNPPEVAIVALGRVRQGLRLDGEGRVAGLPVMNVSWGADHRVVDGATLAGFSTTWKGLLEEPGALLLLCR